MRLASLGAERSRGKKAKRLRRVSEGAGGEEVDQGERRHGQDENAKRGNQRVQQFAER